MPLVRFCARGDQRCSSPTATLDRWSGRRQAISRL